LLGVPPGVIEVRQQPPRGVVVHVRIEVNRDVARLSGQVEQLVVLEPVLPPRRRRTAVHAPILSQPHRQATRSWKLFCLSSTDRPAKTYREPRMHPRVAIGPATVLAVIAAIVGRSGFGRPRL
jgi:hypothetical protein